MKRRLLCLLLAACGATAFAQPSQVAVPYYTAEHFVSGLYRHGHAPRAAAFRAEADALVPALQRLCDARDGAAALRDARTRWQAAARTWDGLAAIALGPLVQRRSQRQIDFTPTRPASIQRAIRAAPADLPALERVGTPAKGLPALEWLLWTQPVAPGTAGCRYAGLLAREVAVEARALDAAFAALAAAPPQGEAAQAAMAEAVNQWVGGLERLRWTRMARPLQAAQPGAAPAYPRAASGGAAAGWRAAWEALQAFARATGAAPAPGAGLVPLETYLRGRGLNPLADRLASVAAEAAAAMERVDPAQPGTVTRAAEAVQQVHLLAQAQLAPALEVQLGFSDSDGD